jgi:hypothetical protein
VHDAAVLAPHDQATAVRDGMGHSYGCDLKRPHAILLQHSHHFEPSRSIAGQPKQQPALGHQHHILANRTQTPQRPRLVPQAVAPHPQISAGTTTCIACSTPLHHLGTELNMQPISQPPASHQHPTNQPTLIQQPFNQWLCQSGPPPTPTPTFQGGTS